VRSSLLANGAWSNAIYLQAMLCGSEPFRNVRCDDPPNAVVNQYRTRDGRWLLLALVQEDKLWPPFCQAIERADLADDPRFAAKRDRRAHARELCALLAPIFASRDFAEWRERLDKRGITFGHVARLDELADDPQLAAAGVFAELRDEHGATLRTVSSPIEVRGESKVAPRRAPEVGEHTDEVLRGLGYDAERIASLRASGAVR
jgi:formyl-CoA transferase